MILVLALLIGVVAGLRAFTAPAAVSWAAALGLLGLEGSWLEFLGYRFTPWIFTVVAVLELIGDQLPSTPSRKVPMQFITRLVMGGLSGGAIGVSGGMLIAGLVAGIVGAVIGTYGGAAARAALARSFGRDLPAALIEDIVAVGGAFLIVHAL
ncbi:hypothetical protein [Novosphingobium sp. AP12]|uniref:hypothetical protein n=1 Tax=Novosphingobium sp. AP12 TaxID=1144305 RepID=UPI000271D872|nr:hypothetical protein [Novosphingobium sp. AP12]EJL33530.1 putative membrane protein [Novosphingobium sp. AP12]